MQKTKGWGSHSQSCGVSAEEGYGGTRRNHETPPRSQLASIEVNNRIATPRPVHHSSGTSLMIRDSLFSGFSAMIHLAFWDKLMHYFSRANTS